MGDLKIEFPNQSIGVIDIKFYGYWASGIENPDPFSKDVRGNTIIVVLDATIEADTEQARKAIINSIRAHIKSVYGSRIKRGQLVLSSSKDAKKASLFSSKIHKFNID